MRRFALAFTIALLGVAFIAAQFDLPPLPLNLGTLPLLLPGAERGAALAAEDQAYLVLATAGDVLNVRMERTSGDLIPALWLRDEVGTPLQEAYSLDLEGRFVELEYTVTQTGWYVITAGRDAAVAPNSSGTYFITLTGTTDQLYGLLPIGAPPLVEGAHIFLGGAVRGRSDEPLHYVVPLLPGDTLAVTNVDNVSIQLLDATGQPLNLPDADYRSRRGEWLQLRITPRSAAQYAVTIEIQRRGNNLLALDTLITSTPTFTSSPTDTPTLTPTFTPSLTPSPTQTFTRTFTPSATFTATNTPTQTYTPSPTFTASWTAVVTKTPPPTATLTHTVPPTSTLTPSRTLPPLRTATPTQRPTATATREPTPSNCPSLLPSRLSAGVVGRITPGAPNNLRTGPSRDNPRLAQIPAGNTVIILDGPMCAGGYTWWQVDYNGIIGWTVEGSGSEYYIEPVQPPTAVVAASYPPYPRQCAQSLVTRLTPNMRILTIRSVRLRESPTSQAGIALADGTDMLTLGIPVCAFLENNPAQAELLWWPVRILEGTLEGEEGWIAESSLNGYNVDYDTTP